MKKITLLAICCLLMTVYLFANSNQATIAEKNVASQKNTLPKHNPEKKFNITEKSAETLQNQGNFQDAFNIYQQLLLDKNFISKNSDKAALLDNAIFCLNRLYLEKDFDSFIAKVLQTYPNNWQVTAMAAKHYLNIRHYGFIIAGKFERGAHRGGGESVIATERDRCHSLQLYVKAMQQLSNANKVTTEQKQTFFINFANALNYQRSGSQSWRLQYLTDLNKLPDYRKGYRWYNYYSSSRGAPVNAAGNPVFYKLPKSLSAAVNDGERWRWALNASKKAGNKSADFTWAKFLLQQFGVQTMAFRIKPTEHKDGPFAVHLLTDNETIAKLATGVQRFKLPDEYNYILIFKQLSNGKNSIAEQSLNQLAGIFSNRRQYVKAAEAWQQSIKRFGAGSSNWKAEQLKQIVGNWGEFQSVNKFPAGTPPELQLRYRNAKQVSLSLYKLKRDTYLTALQHYLENNPPNIDWYRINLNQIGYMVVVKHETRYLDKLIKQWQQKLTPLKKHFDRIEKITLPVTTPGIYLLKAKMTDGNISRIIVWITNTAIVSRTAGNYKLFYVADAADGSPVTGAKINFFGYRTKYLSSKWLKLRRFDVQVDKFSVTTDKNGMIKVPHQKFLKYYSYLKFINSNNRFAATGFAGYWYPQNYRANYNLRKIFGISDRPVYRPGQKVYFKYWIAQATYAEKNRQHYANIPVTVEIRSPRGEKIWTKTLTTNKLGGIDGVYPLPTDASLGNYTMLIKNWGGYFHFRVEEYKKPEFAVTVDAPKRPVTLGDKFTATIQAKYYFGAPVTKAKVKYKVLRYTQDFSWYPPSPWDWLYGAGYWWFSCDYSWYPGWESWGWQCPVRRWLPWYRAMPNQPEVVAENELNISPDGTAKITIDSAPAKAVFGDHDSLYEITAEVVDSSRHTVVGRGKVIAAAKPLHICVWTTRGFYQTDNNIEIGIKAVSAVNKGISGKGLLTLFLINYDRAGKPQERALRQWKINTDANGDAKTKFTVSNAGQYRLAYELRAGKKGFASGGTIFTVLTDTKKISDNCRFSALELINAKKEYAPGDELNLMINANRPNSTVILFVRAGNSDRVTPEVIRLKGKTAFRKIKITKADMPNFFIEAWTVVAGKIHKVVRRIAVPPEKRVLNVEVMPSKKRYKPGEKATLKLTITDYLGNPVQGDVVVSIYDKSVEYISGGSNVANIQPFFWKWLKKYYSQLGFSMNGWFGNILKRGEQTMHYVGIFGRLISPRNKNKGDNIADNILGARVMMKSKATFAGAEDDEVASDKAPKPVEPAVKVRTQFADTAYWAASLTANQQGIVEISLKMPENLTTWKIKAWSMASGTRVGQGETEVITTKDFLIRMQLPRFLVNNDRAVISAIVHNYLPKSKIAEVSLKLTGKALQCTDHKPVKIGIASQGEKRLDWRVKAVHAGQATVTMSAITSGDGDAMKMNFPVLVNGIDKQQSYSGALRGDKQIEHAFITINLPKARVIDSVKLQLNYSPTLAAAMLDALPYLVSSDYHNTEATLNRFLPAVMVQHALNKAGINFQQLRDKITNLNPQEIGKADKRSKQWQRWGNNPVFDDQQLKQLVSEGTKALRCMQNSDGGWGWFSGYNEHSWADTTSQVVRGLLLARENNIKVDANSLQRGINWLKNQQQQRLHDIQENKSPVNNRDALVCRALVMAGVNDKNISAMSNYLYLQRNNLSLYGKALLALTLNKCGLKAQVTMLKQNIEQFLMQDNENQTAWLRLPENNCWWFWYGSEYETQAAYLELLNRTAPGSDIASRLVKYLLNNRKHATYWNSTRDTAYCLEAMAGYLASSNEMNPNMTVKVMVDGNLVKTVKITKANLFSFDSTLMMYGKQLTTGKHTIELQREGKGPLYFNAYLNYFTLEKFIKKTGLEIKVERRYYKLKRQPNTTIKTAGGRGQAVDMKVEKYRRIPLKNMDKLKSGDLIEVEMIIDSKNDYSYLMFEDRKIAGCEPVDLRSGYNGNALNAYVEFRDANVRFFVRNLMRGKHSVSYRLRAEIPGTFSALPASGVGIYAPELKANSDEFNINIED